MRAATWAANILRTLSAMAEDAITDELIGANPFNGTRVRRSDSRAGRQPRRPRVLTWAQLHAFAAAAGRHEPTVRMLGDCGLRVGELFVLSRELQDLREGVFVVRGSGLGGRGRRELADDGARSLGADPARLPGAPARDAGADRHALAVPTPAGRLWRINSFYRDVWCPARHASGLECTPQDFRHSYISNLSAAGIDVADLADISGHSVGTAQQRYRHALRRSFEQIRETIG